MTFSWFFICFCCCFLNPFFININSLNNYFILSVLFFLFIIVILLNIRHQEYQSDFEMLLDIMHRIAKGVNNNNNNNNNNEKK